MKANIILGVNIDTQVFITILKKECAENIIVLDYELQGDTFKDDGVLYVSAYTLNVYLKLFREVKFFKSIYIYPGMSRKNSR